MVSMESHLENNIAHHSATRVTSKTYLAKQSTTFKSSNTKQQADQMFTNFAKPGIALKTGFEINKAHTTESHKKRFHYGRSPTSTNKRSVQAKGRTKRGHQTPKSNVPRTLTATHVPMCECMHTCV